MTFSLNICIYKIVYIHTYKDRYTWNDVNRYTKLTILYIPLFTHRSRKNIKSKLRLVIHHLKKTIYPHTNDGTKRSTLHVHEITPHHLTTSPPKHATTTPRHDFTKLRSNTPHHTTQYIKLCHTTPHLMP